jgi:pilus assembly protein Flp/PilA
MGRLLTAFFNDERGVTAIEYALIASVIALGIIISVSATGNKLKTTFSTVANSL